MKEPKKYITVGTVTGYNPKWIEWEKSQKTPIEKLEIYLAQNPIEPPSNDTLF